MTDPRTPGQDNDRGARLVASGYRRYRGEDADVYFSRDICQHSGNCVRGLPEVFDRNRRPWILTDNAPADRLEALIGTCPSGALQFVARD